MRKIVFLTILAYIVGTTALQAQILEPVKWEFSKKKINNTTYEIHATATIDDGWHVYSQHTEEGGPLPTEFVVEMPEGLKQKGPIKEVGELHKKYEEVFMVNTMYFDKKVDFVQTIEVSSKGAHTLKGYVTFMACNNETCLPPTDADFEIVLN